MARRGPTFVCQNCGAVSGRWQGKCDACGEWNTLLEEGAALGRSVLETVMERGQITADPGQVSTIR